MQKGKYKIRNMTKDELEIAIRWAASEGWNPGLYDRDCFYCVDEKGFFMGFLDGKPISSISTVAYDDSFGFLGFYIVKPEYRGNGYGYKLWKESIKHLDSQNIGLDGVVDQQDNYKKSGFKLAYRNIRFEGISRKYKENSVLKDISEVSFNKILQYDRKMFPAERKSFLRKWFGQPESKSFVAVGDGEIVGYGTIRKCRNGYKVGPLFANKTELAEKILQSLVSYIDEGTSYYLDTPEVNKEAVKLAQRYRMKPIFETARMYTKEEPKINLQKIFGVTTFELG